MNQTNILVVASSLAALLTLGVVTVSQWVAPWVPFAVGAGWLVFWGVAWVTLRTMDEVDVPSSPAETMPALVSAALVPLLGALWMVSPVRATVAPFAVSSSPSAIDSILGDSSSDVGLAACESAMDTDPMNWTSLADAIAARTGLAMQCLPSLTPELIDAVGDRWATALKRPTMDKSTACTLTENLAQLRDGRPEVLSQDLMRCINQSESEAARVCCEQTFDAAVEPIALLDAATPSPSVLASFIRVQFRPGESLDEELAGRLLDATCEAPERSQVTAAYLPYVREKCGAKAGGWLDGYGANLWREACAEELPYFRSAEQRPADESLCRGLETAAVAIAVDEAKTKVGYGRSTGRSQDGVSPGVLAEVARTARARGGGTSGAGIEQDKAERPLPPEFMWSRRKDLIVRDDPEKSLRECRRMFASDPDMKNFAGIQKMRPGAETTADLVGFDPCTADDETIDAFGNLFSEDYDPDAEGDGSKLEEDDINSEVLMRAAPNAKAAGKLKQELLKASQE